MKNEIIPVIKNTEEEQLVPTIWRETLFKIVEAFKEGDFELKRTINDVSSISSKDALMIKENIEDYGVTLKSLPKKTWKTSVCLWMEDYWDVFVDLYSVELGETDLVLSVRIYEKNDGYIFNIHSVYVP
jgi:hypothetical protein